MLSRKVFQVVIIPLIIFLLMVFAASGAYSADKTVPPQEVKKGRTGSGAAGASGPHVSGPVKATLGSKSFTFSRSFSRTRNAFRNPLACPATFLQDGVYIWCDPDGIWSISWWAREYFVLNAILTAKEPITVKRSVQAITNSPETESGQLEISSSPEARGGIVQFMSADDSVQFQILIDGLTDPNRVYIGSQLYNPKQLPFKLQTRRMLTHNGIPMKASASRGQDSEESINNYGTSLPNPSQTNVMTEPSPRSGGRGHGGGGTSGEKAHK